MMRKRIKVLQLIGGLNRGGAEMVVINLCNFLNPEEFEVRICSLMDSIPLASRLIRPEEVKVTTCGIRPGFPSPGNYLRTGWNVQKVVREFRPDVVHSHLYSTAAPLQFLGTLNAGARHLVTIHAAGYHYVRQNHLPASVFRWLENVNVRLCGARLITVSNAVRDVVMRSLHVGPNQVQTIYNGTDVSVFSRDKGSITREAIGFLGDDLVVAYTARLYEVKGHEYLVKAWPKVVSAVPNAKLLLIGAGYLRESLQELARQLGVQESILFMGAKDNVRDYLALCDVGVFPSLTEGLGLAAIEMMAMSLPVVASTIPALREVVNPPECGIGVPPGQPEPLAEGLIRLLTDRVLRLRMGQAARKRAVDMFSIESQVKSHEVLYRQLCLEGRDGRSLGNCGMKDGVLNHG